MTDAKIYEYTQKQKWLEWLRIEIIKQFNNNIDISNFDEKNAIITHVYSNYEQERLYNTDFTLAFLNQSYYKIAHEILTYNQKEQKRQAKLYIEEQKRLNALDSINRLKAKIYAPFINMLLIIPLTFLYYIIFNI